MYMCTYIISFRMTIYSADSNCEIRVLFQKRASPFWNPLDSTNKFLRTKSHTGSKFSQISLGFCASGALHLYCHLSLWSQMVPQQTAKFRAASFRHFRSMFEEG